MLLAAADAALPFRRAALGRLDVPDLGWDAARHTLAGLDLFDELRRFHLLHALGAVLSQHWWPPLHGLLLAPLFAVFGVSLSTATLPSLLAHLLAALACALLAARLAPSPAPFAALAAGALLVRAPHVLEVSAWAMLESTGAFLTVLAWLFFARRESPRARAAAYATTAALFFLKYLYGVFVAVPFAIVTYLELPAEERASLRVSVGGLGRAARIGGAALLLLAAARFAAEGVNARAARFLPSVPNLAWLLLVGIAVAAAARRRATARRLRALPAPARSFLVFAVLPPCAWLLDPANMRAFYNQLFAVPAKGSEGVLHQAAAVSAMVRGEFLPATPLALVFVLGLGAALVSKDPTLRALAWGTVAPAALMCLSRHALEPRYLVTLAPAAFAAAGAGAARILGAAPRPVGVLAGGAGSLALAGYLLSTRAAFAGDMGPREAYRYQYAPDDLAALRALEPAPDGALPVFAAVADEHQVSPTLRLSWRLRLRTFDPPDVDAVQGPPDAAARLFRDSDLPDAELVTLEDGRAVVRRARASAPLRAPAATPSAGDPRRSPTGSRPSR